mmetsp:Transcript_36629/g.85230  ORF Transcript_36629/g.85230 Transcript_36629/m.85230 type:complete len:80 (-) Transcript_36629:358-597(-)
MVSKGLCKHGEAAATPEAGAVLGGAAPGKANPPAGAAATLALPLTLVMTAGGDTAGAELPEQGTSAWCRRGGSLSVKCV